MTKTRLLLFMGLALLLAACGGQKNTWAGLSRTPEGEIFVSYGEFIARLDANGKRQWTYPQEDDREGSIQFYAQVVYTEDTVYVGDYAGGVHALDRETGKERWVYSQGGRKLLGIFNFGASTDRIIGSVTVGENVIYVPDEKGIFLLDKATGKRLDDWDFESERAVWSQPVYVPASGEQPARLFVTGLDHYLYALNADTGEILWKTDLEGSAPAKPAFNAEANMLFAGTLSGHLFAVNADSGEILDDYTTDGWIWEEPVLVENNLYFTDLDGYVHALLWNEGQLEELWSRRVEQDGKLRAQPLIVDNFLFVSSSEGNVYSINRENGEEEWKKELNDDYELFSSMVFVERQNDNGEVERLVLVATDNKEQLVLALDIENGNQRWSYKHED